MLMSFKLEIYLTMKRRLRSFTWMIMDHNWWYGAFYLIAFNNI